MRGAVIEAEAAKARYSSLQRLLAAVLCQAGGKIEIPKSTVMDRDRLRETIHVHNPETAEIWTIELKPPGWTPEEPKPAEEPPKCNCDFSQMTADNPHRPKRHAPTCPARHEFARPELVPGQVESHLCPVHRILIPAGVPCPQCSMNQLKESALCECGHAQLNNHLGGFGRCKRCECDSFKCAHTNRVLNVTNHTAVCVACDDVEQIKEQEANATNSNPQA